MFANLLVILIVLIIGSSLSFQGATPAYRRLPFADSSVGAAAVTMSASVYSRASWFDASYMQPMFGGGGGGGSGSSDEYTRSFDEVELIGLSSSPNAAVTQAEEVGGEESDTFTDGIHYKAPSL